MITVPLTNEDLTKVRLAPSTLWETVISFRVLLHHGRDTVHAPWATRTRRVLPGTDLSPLLAAMCLEKHCPDFLSPPPDASLVGFDEELERLRATPPEVVHTEVQMLVQAEKEQFGPLSPEKELMLEIYLSDPEGSLMRLVDTLQRYHDLTIAPYWQRIQEHLEGDTIKRGQALALGGVEALLESAGRGLILVSCVFAWPRIMVLTEPGYRPTLAYGPRGVANLWSSSSTASNGTALEAALGAGRASILKGLLPVPRTTTELAHQLRLSPATVSAHLLRLKAAELVEPHRSGKRVYYRLSCAGESLLGIFGETS